MQWHSNTLWLVGGLAIGLAFSAGLFVGGKTEPAPTVETDGIALAQSPWPDDVARDLVAELRALRTSLQEAQAIAIERPVVQPVVYEEPARRSAREDAATGFEDFEAWLERVDQRLEKIAEISLSRAARPEPDKPRERSMQGLVVPSAFGVLRIPDDEEEESPAWRQFRDRHVFWSYQQVLDTYGPPTHVWRNGEMTTWYYEFTEERGVEFRFMDGVVIYSAPS